MKQHVVISLLAFLVPCISLAAPPPDEIRYSYIDLGLTGGQVDAGGVDFDFGTASVTGSWGVNKNIALFAGFAGGIIDVESVGFCCDIETSEFAIGINPHFALAKNVDIIFPIGALWAEFDDGFFIDDDTGYTIGVGIRALVHPRWELSAGVQHVEIFDDDDQSFGGSVRWHIVSLFSLALGVSFADDSESATLSARFTF
ncbi:MAG: hypothetical protein AMS22_03140 [Thiotrichales bacterium SG8_50]|nr:MAG: hypothetical protein AMS22_03140 [Thiotrichales bacterium SG8_50]